MSAPWWRLWPSRPAPEPESDPRAGEIAALSDKNRALLHDLDDRGVELAFANAERARLALEVERWQGEHRDTQEACKALAEKHEQLKRQYAEAVKPGIAATISSAEQQIKIESLTREIEMLAAENCKLRSDLHFVMTYEAIRLAKNAERQRRNRARHKAAQDA